MLCIYNSKKKAPEYFENVITSRKNCLMYSVKKISGLRTIISGEKNTIVNNTNPSRRFVNIPGFFFSFFFSFPVISG